jgi:hypothetical protein
VCGVCENTNDRTGCITLKVTYKSQYKYKCMVYVVTGEFFNSFKLTCDLADAGPLTNVLILFLDAVSSVNQCICDL